MTDIDPKEVNIGSEALSGGVARAFLLGIGFIGSIIFARVLGATGFGAFYLLVTIENIVDRPLSGFAVAVKKRLSESDSNPAELIGAYFVVLLPFIALIIGGVIVGQDWLNGYVQRGDAYLLFIALFTTLSLQDTLNTLLSATGRVGLTNWVDAFRSLLTIPAQVTLVLLGYGVAGMTTGLAGASLITALLILYMLSVRPERPSQETFKSLYQYAKYSVPSQLTSFGYGRISLLIIGAYLGPTVAGYFEATLKLTVPALVVGMMAAGVLMPKVSDLSSRGEAVTGELYDVMSYSSVIAIPVAFGAFAVAHQLVITVYGNEFAPAAKFLTGLAVYRVVNTRTQPLVSTLQGLDRPDFDLYGTLAAFGVLLGVGVPALWEFGAMGILGGMICAACTRYAIAAYFVRSELGTVPQFPRPFLAQLTAGIVMFGGVELLQQSIGFGPWYEVFLLVGVGAIVYFTMLFFISRKTRHTVVYVLDDFAEEKLGRRVAISSRLME